MFSYTIRRILYALLVLLGVNALLFLLYFKVFSPDDMAARVLGEKRVTQEDLNNWKHEHGYDLPTFYNKSAGTLWERCTETIFWTKSIKLFIFEFGNSDNNTDSNIGKEVKQRIPPSLALSLPIFFASLLANMIIAMIVAFYRATYIDTWVLILCVIMMSISALYYIIGGQYLFGILLRLAPVSGYSHGLSAAKFLILPIFIGIIGSVGGGIRYYRTIFLEEINKDYIRTARAKGLTEGRVLFKHALKNAMIPILTNVVVSIPFLIMGNLLLENFFGIPGLGSYLVDAIGKQDFAVIRSMVFLSAVLYVSALVCVDISYTFADPRIRLK
ncbi:MAG: ABC transporter permease [Kiritimatiellae bacterium]|nr:ABC transporter permease [Kiritimatiellia bacterium]